MIKHSTQWRQGGTRIACQGIGCDILAGECIDPKVNNTGIIISFETGVILALYFREASQKTTVNANLLSSAKSPTTTEGSHVVSTMGASILLRPEPPEIKDKNTKATTRNRKMDRTQSLFTFSYLQPSLNIGLNINSLVSSRTSQSIDDAK